MTDNDFRQFKGAFDSAMEPDNAFVERLQRRMKTEAPARADSVKPTVIASPPSPPDHAPPPPRHSHPLFIAAAVLIVFALAAASIVQLAPRVLETEYAAQSVATLPADVSTTPGADVALSAASLPELQSVSYTHPHGDNLIAVRYVPPTDAQRLVSYNVPSGEVQWEQDVSASAHFLFGENEVVAVSYIQPDAETVNALPEFDELVGYDVQTGEKIWTRSVADWKMEHGWETVVLAGEAVVFLRGGELVGIDPQTGETMWQAPYTLAPAVDESWVQPPALIAIEGNLFLLQVDGSIEVFDLETGASIRGFSLPGSFQDLNPVGMQLFEVPAGLLVTADTFSGPGALTTLLMIDPENGEVIWQRSLDYSGVIDVSPGGTIAIAMHNWESPPLLMRLLGRDGYSTSALTWLDADGEVIMETDRVRMPEMGGLVISANDRYLCGTTEELSCFDRTGTRYTFDASTVWDAVWVGEDLLLMTDRGVMRVELP